MENQKNILWFQELGIKDVPLVGGKNASLGEMYNNLTSKGVNLANGFAITAAAYFYFLKSNNLTEKISDTLKDLDVHDIKNLQKRGKIIRELIKSAKFPEDLADEIVSSYKKLSELYKEENTDVAVRSSATAEDLPGASFAGQQETFLNVQGPENILEAVNACTSKPCLNANLSPGSSARCAIIRSSI